MSKKKANKQSQREPKSTTASSSKKDDGTVEIDSKYRLMLLAARRAKQIQKGAKSHIRYRKNERGIKSLGRPGSIGISRIRSAVQEVAEETFEGE